MTATGIPSPERYVVQRVTKELRSHREPTVDGGMPLLRLRPDQGEATLLFDSYQTTLMPYQTRCVN